MHAKHK
jgi:hypothetical protein